MRYRPNSSLYRAAGQLRYVEARLANKERTRRYHLVAVDSDEVLAATLSRASAGATHEALAAALVAADGAGETTRDEADAFVDELVAAQLLVPELAPQVTGAEPIHDLLAQLATGAPAAAAALARVHAALTALDGCPLGASPTRYRDIAGLVGDLGVEAELARLFQVDLVKSSPRATLGPEPLAELVRVVEQLRRVTERPRDTALERFAADFVARYEGRAVPLAQALDEESGIGFQRSAAPTAEGAPLLEGLAFAEASDDAAATFGPLQRLLFTKLLEAERRGADEIVLDERDLAPLAARAPTALPGSLAVSATLAARSAEAVAAGDFTLLLNGVSGPSGANLLGRFCHGDPQLTEAVRAHLRDEEAQHPDAVFAELVHLPEGRAGNILLRPLLREHEISFLGRSGAPAAQQLTVDDLLVSVEGGRVVLRARTHGREVIPRLTTAHAFTSPLNLGVYRFLCALQSQGLAPLDLSWGALAAAPRLPRLRLGKVVLQLARWRLDRATLAELGAPGDATARFARVQALRPLWRLPRWVAVADGDNVLPIDLDNPLCVETFVQLVKERSEVTLTERFRPDELCAYGPEGAFVHELVIPMLARAPVAPAAPAAAVAPTRLVRHLPPGSDWLYAKLYCGNGTADAVLRDQIAPLLDRARAHGAVDDWFFVRYGDPDWHLRVRFRGDSTRLRREVQPLVTEAAAAAGERLWKLQLDSYQRELERYGGDDGMLLAERLFGADSDAALAMLQTLAGDAGAEARWRLTLRGIDQLLDDLGLSLEEKFGLMTRLRDGFAREQRADATLERQLGERFRRERPALEALLDRARDATSDLEPGLTALARRSLRLEPIGAALRAQAAAGRLSVSLHELASSFVHMHANRMLRGAARAQELVIYDFLKRLYEGRRARTKQRAR